LLAFWATVLTNEKKQCKLFVIRKNDLNMISNTLGFTSGVKKVEFLNVA